MANLTFPEAEIYTTHTCSDCHQLKVWLVRRRASRTSN